MCLSLFFASLFLFCTSCLFLFDIIAVGSEFLLYETPVFLSFSSQLWCWLLGVLAFSSASAWSVWQRTVFGVALPHLLGLFGFSIVVTCGLLLDNQEGLTELSEYLVTSPQMLSLCWEWVGYVNLYYLFLSLVIGGRAQARVMNFRLRNLSGFLLVTLILGWFFLFFFLMCIFIFKGTQLVSCVRGCCTVFLPCSRKNASSF